MIDLHLHHTRRQKSPSMVRQQRRYECDVLGVFLSAASQRATMRGRECFRGGGEDTAARPLLPPLSSFG